MTTDSGSSESYRPEIDGLRALAVLAVIANHFDSRVLPSGHLGVDIFFVISGYVITATLFARDHSGLGPFLAGFYERRMKRLLPALVLCVLLTGLAISLFNPNPVVSLKTGIAALFGVSNLFLFDQATDYFGVSGQANAFTQTWSLGVEEQFYLLFPLVLWATGLGRRADGERRFGLTIGVLSFMSLALFFYWSETAEAAAFYLMPPRFWELGAGCLIFSILNARMGRLATLLPKVNPLAVLGAIVVVLAWPANNSALATLAVVSLTALLIVTLSPGGAAYRLLASRTATYVGRISYSLYLWHWSVIAISHWTVGIHWWSVPLQFALMLWLADWSYRRFEKPLRHAQWASHRGRAFLYGAGAAVAVAGVLVVLAKPMRGVLYTGQQPALAAVGGSSLTLPYAIEGQSSTWRGEACVLSDNDQVGKAIPIEECTLGDFQNATRRVLVLGNSFSTAFVQSFDDLVAMDDHAVVLTSSWGASPVPGVPNEGPWNEASDYYWSEVAPSLIARLQPGDWVLLINDLAALTPRRRTRESQARLEAFGRGLESFSIELAERGIRLAALHGIPFAREAGCEPAAAVPQWFAPAGGPCQYLTRDETLLRRADLAEVLAALEANGRISAIDLVPVFCPGERCTYRSHDGQLLYRDSYSHPSVEAARLSAPVIRATLTAGD